MSFVDIKYNCLRNNHDNHIPPVKLLYIVCIASLVKLLDNSEIYDNHGMIIMMLVLCRTIQKRMILDSVQGLSCHVLRCANY